MHSIDRQPSERLARPGRRIVIAGTGGQGVLTAARLLCDAFVARGHHVVSGQLHGMAQRGGSVQATVVIDGGISPVVAAGRADIVLGFEPVETARAIPLMSSDTLVFSNTAPVVPYVLAQQFVMDEGDGKYPDVGDVLDAVRSASGSLLAFDATRIATECGPAKALNMVMLGSLFGGGDMPCSADEFWSIVADNLPRGLKELNAKAFHAGVRAGKQSAAVRGGAS